MITVQTPAARKADPISSHLAEADINDTGTRHRQQLLVAELIEDAYRTGEITESKGITSRELSGLSGVDRYMIARRLPELVTAKRVIQGDKDSTRRCEISNRQCVQWWPSHEFMQLCDKQRYRDSGRGA